MQKNKLIYSLLSLAMVGIMAVSSPAALTANAAMHSTVIVENHSNLSDVAVQTPANSAKAYGLMNWAEEGAGFHMTLIMNNSICGPNAAKLLGEATSSRGASMYGLYDPELYRKLDGCMRRTILTPEPLQLCIALPKASADLDWAIISYNVDAGISVFPDIDADDSTITFTANNFLLWALVSAPKGSFKANKPLGISKYATSMEKGLSAYPKFGSVYSSISRGCITTPVDAIGIVSAYGEVCTAMNLSEAERQSGLFANLSMYSSDAGLAAKNAVNAAIVSAKGQNAIYLDVDLNKQGNGSHYRVTKTSAPLTVTMSVPGTFPMYADYAVVVLGEDGTAKVFKDIDTDASTISFTTTDFRMIAVIHGTPGSFDSFK